MMLGSWDGNVSGPPDTCAGDLGSRSPALRVPSDRVEIMLPGSKPEAGWPARRPASRCGIRSAAAPWSSRRGRAASAGCA